MIPIQRSSQMTLLVIVQSDKYRVNTGPDTKNVVIKIISAALFSIPLKF